MKHAAIQHNGLRITGQWATDPTEFQPKNKKGNYGPPVPCSPDGSIGEAYADCNIYAVSRGTLVYVPANVNLTLKKITGTAHAISDGVLTVTRTVKTKTAAEKAAESEAQFKSERTALVEAITVTVDGMEFDGDETSQNRMSRAVSASSPGDSTYWRLSDDTVTTVTHEQLKQALLKAGQAQTAVWFPV